MQRQLCLKLISKIPRNPSSPITNSIPSKPCFSSSFLKTNANPFHQQFFSQHSTLSRSHMWKIWSNNGVSGRIRNGFFSSPVFARRYFSNALLKGLGKFPGVQTRRNFHSVDSRNRERGSVFRRLTADGVVIWLVATNVAVFILWKVAPLEFMVKNFVLSVDNITSGRLHTFVTHAFSHVGINFLGSSLIGFSFGGLSIARRFGPGYLLKLYLSGAVICPISDLAYNALIAALVNRQMLRFDPSEFMALGAHGPVLVIMLSWILLLPVEAYVFLLFRIKTPDFGLIKTIPMILGGICVVGNDILTILQGGHDGSTTAPYSSGGILAGTVAAFACTRSKRGHFRPF